VALAASEDPANRAESVALAASEDPAEDNGSIILRIAAELPMVIVKLRTGLAGPRAGTPSLVVKGKLSAILETVETGAILGVIVQAATPATGLGVRGIGQAAVPATERVVPNAWETAAWGAQVDRVVLAIAPAIAGVPRVLAAAAACPAWAREAIAEAAEGLVEAAEGLEAAEADDVRKGGRS